MEKRPKYMAMSMVALGEVTHPDSKRYETKNVLAICGKRKAPSCWSSAYNSQGQGGGLGDFMKSS